MTLAQKLGYFLPVGVFVALIVGALAYTAYIGSKMPAVKDGIQQTVLGK